MGCAQFKSLTTWFSRFMWKGHRDSVSFVISVSILLGQCFVFCQKLSRKRMFPQLFLKFWKYLTFWKKIIMLMRLGLQMQLRNKVTKCQIEKSRFSKTGKCSNGINLLIFLPLTDCMQSAVILLSENTKTWRFSWKDNTVSLFRSSGNAYSLYACIRAEEGPWQPLPPQLGVHENN